MFSGGAASSYCAWWVVNKYGKENVILLHTPTYSEDKDADRFRKQVAEYLGIKMTEPEDGRDIWEVIEDSNCLPSHFIPFCTQVLKLKPMLDWLKEYTKENKDLILYYGFSREEPGRIQKQTARIIQMRYEKTYGGKPKYNKSKISTCYPLVEDSLTSNDCKRIITTEWGICMPVTYKIYEHNNCIPCFKSSSKKYWAKVAKHNPIEFQKAIDAEHFTGHTHFKDMTLEELREKAEIYINQIDMFEEVDNFPCMCSF